MGFQSKLTLRGGQAAPRGAEPSPQVGALCCRGGMSGGQDVLVVTSRDTGRWIIPKGWLKDGDDPASTALAEAWEEAGVRRASVIGPAVGYYHYTKTMEDGELRPCRVTVIPLKVAAMADDFPEAHERRRKWVPAKRAAELVEEPELKAILKRFG